ncbi:MAG: type II toxin-antitoxin system RelE/ParE family toxin [Gammaproteobacteria bacterium]|nr:type II toxin-antitoxin system RelE/ParE family toxin [Gammaproteobacteria bacterium]
MVWRVQTLNDAVDREFDALPADMRARFARMCQLVASVGLDRMGAPHVRHVTGPLWEMRLAGRDGIARALYVAATGRRVVVVRVFVKKTRRTPRREIDVALKRAREVLQ